MIDRSEAEEHLRVIRSLMEKATIYRAISAEAAAASGITALIAAFGSLRLSTSIYVFTLKWLVVLVICSGANLFFIARDARRRGDAFISPGMRLALAAMSPAMFCGGVFTLIFVESDAAAPFWMMCYGLALTSTSAFAPRSIVLLGWAFILAGLYAFFSCFVQGRLDNVGFSNVLMGCTFGAFHLIYAACTWPRRAQ